MSVKLGVKEHTTSILETLSDSSPPHGDLYAFRSNEKFAFDAYREVSQEGKYSTSHLGGNWRSDYGRPVLGTTA